MGYFNVPEVAGTVVCTSLARLVLLAAIYIFGKLFLCASVLYFFLVIGDILYDIIRTAIRKELKHQKSMIDLDSYLRANGIDAELRKSAVQEARRVYRTGQALDYDALNAHPELFAQKLLDRIPFFQNFDSQFLDELASIMRLMQVTYHARIFSQGDNFDSNVYFVLHGHVATYYVGPGGRTEEYLDFPACDVSKLNSGTLVLQTSRSHV